MSDHTGNVGSSEFDTTRSHEDHEGGVPESVQSMVEDFAWLGLDIDEGPTAADLKQIAQFYPPNSMEQIVSVWRFKRLH